MVVHRTRLELDEETITEIAYNRPSSRINAENSTCLVSFRFVEKQDLKVGSRNIGKTIFRMKIAGQSFGGD